MTFGQRVRELRTAKSLTQRELADRIGINFTYLSKIENDKLEQDQSPKEETIKKLAEVLGGDQDELLLLARKIPEQIKQRVMERPDVFRKMASLDDETLNKIMKELDE
ncbi:MAG: helix-turn-helix transcriptional regulator [Tepidisphaeraceae bacterium]